MRDLFICAAQSRWRGHERGAECSYREVLLHIVAEGGHRGGRALAAAHTALEALVQSLYKTFSFNAHRISRSIFQHDKAQAQQRCWQRMRGVEGATACSSPPSLTLHPSHGKAPPLPHLHVQNTRGLLFEVFFSTFIFQRKKCSTNNSRFQQHKLYPP